MHTREDWPPDVVPVLSRGKHRNPRKGGCFMELASYLAGEKWSDHPSCTHPLLAALARDVNDYVSDGNRQRLAPLIPAVIGLTSNDPRLTARIALRAAWAALPVVAEERQRVMAVAVLRCEQKLADLEGGPQGRLQPSSRRVLNQVPLATTWARDFMRKAGDDSISFPDRLAPWILHHAVEGIAEACVADPDDLLVRLLDETIADCRDWVKLARAELPVDDTRWTDVCRLTGVVD